MLVPANNSMQRTALRAAADAERYAGRPNVGTDDSRRAAMSGKQVAIEVFRCSLGLDMPNMVSISYLVCGRFSNIGRWQRAWQGRLSRCRNAMKSGRILSPFQVHEG